ncbi:site-specific integrase [uncultured Roseibium sp.]|uniref:tyrosine-type recombinase/integrase n=1 Tax=uncultured Roseibium sp. TaxID=1936171 RepID=UPI0026159A4A|nr:site-specific integrase [uncultured Roseibium sp.]
MTAKPAHFSMMTLYSITGAPKYLTDSERKRFQAALPILENPVERTFVEMIFWTGCRPCEALGMSVSQVLLDDHFVIIRSAKKRGELKGKHFRPVPLPEFFVERLERTHNIRARLGDHRNAKLRLWTFSRTTGWRLTKRVMSEAGITGIQANSRGLRHTMGTNGMVKHVPQSRMQTWLGHEHPDTTAIYTNAVGAEDHAIAARMW